MRALLVLAVVTSALAFLVSGCGGGSSASPEEQWANSVCSTVGDWADQIKGVASDVQNELKSPSASLGSDIQASVQQGVDDTKTLATNLKALGPPPGENGETAKKLVDSLADDVQQTVTQVNEQAKTISNSSSLTEVATTIATIAADVSSMVTKGKSTVESIQELGGDLKSGFEDAGACKDLKKTFG